MVKQLGQLGRSKVLSKQSLPTSPTPRTSWFASCPFVWAGNEASRFSTRITQERRVKQPNPYLNGGGGTLAPVWPYREAPALAGFHPYVVTQDTLRSRLSTIVLSVTLLASSRAQALWVIETPKDRVGPNVARHSAYLDRIVGLH
jgi:hypothetical protein